MNLAMLRRIMIDHGATRCLFKRLAGNDNSKNQIYFGPNLRSLNIFPFHGKPEFVGQSKDRGPRYTVALDFWWLSAIGTVERSPGAQLILYPQYPEVRLSGMVRGVHEAPGEYLNPEKKGRLGGRVLFLGITPDARILAWLEPPDTELTRELAALSIIETEGVFCDLPLEREPGAGDTRESLLNALARIHIANWIESRRLLPDGGSAPCASMNCGGYTLEAELGISPNGRSEPDFLGWEVKQHNVRDFDNSAPGVLTLMTPEPDGGYYRDHGVDAFVRKFGYPDRRGRPDRLNFGGTHYVDRINTATSLALSLDGYNFENGRIENLSGAVALVSSDGEVAAKWSFEGMLAHWNRKHARAVYVPSQRRKDPRHEYRYGHTVRLGVGTDFERLLRAFRKGQVYYDPGIKLEHASAARPRVKRRSQFRIKSSGLGVLYEQFKPVRLPGC